MKNAYLFPLYQLLPVVSQFPDRMPTEAMNDYPLILFAASTYTKMQLQVQALYFSAILMLFNMLSVTNFTEISTCLSTYTNYKSLSAFCQGNNSYLNRQ